MESYDDGDPFGEARESSRYSFESDAASGHSTLVETRGEEAIDPFGDCHAVEVGENEAFRLLLPSMPAQRDDMRGAKQEKGCQCTLIQHQRRKLHPSRRRGDLIVRHAGTRPDFASTVREALSPASTGKTMVAVCARKEVAQQVETAVSKMNFDAALGRRKQSVDIFVEGFS